MSEKTKKQKILLFVPSRPISRNQFCRLMVGFRVDGHIYLYFRDVLMSGMHLYSRGIHISGVPISGVSYFKESLFQECPYLRGSLFQVYHYFRGPSFQEYHYFRRLSQGVLISGCPYFRVSLFQGIIISWGSYFRGSLFQG